MVIIFTISLHFGELFDLNDPFLSVNAGDLSLGSLMRSSNNCDFIILSDWKSTNIVLLSEVLGEMGSH